MINTWDLRTHLEKQQEIYESLIQLLDFAKHVSALPNCNDCGSRKLCKYLPRLGDPVRYNCPLWKKKDD